MSEVHRFRTSDNLSISYEDSGQGRAIVFIHGWAATRRFWSGQLADLSKRFRVVALDLRGHGDSDKNLEADYTVDRMSNDLDELIRSLGLRDYVLVGHSMGGAIAVKHAERKGASSLVLTGVSTSIEGGLSLLSLEILMKFRGLAEKVVTPRMFALGADERLLEFVRRESAKSSVEVLMKVMRQVAGTDLKPLIGNVKIPALVVAGERDSVAPSEQQKRLAQLLGARFVVLEGAGHNLMLERPSEFSRTISEFASSY